MAKAVSSMSSPQKANIPMTPIKANINSDQIQQAKYGIKYDPTTQQRLNISPERFQSERSSGRQSFGNRVDRTNKWGSDINERLMNNIRKRKELEQSTRLNNQLNTVQPGFARATGGTAQNIRQSVGISKSPNAGTTAFRSEVINRAKRYLGTPYSLGGGHQPNAVTPSRGFNGLYGLDCSGLTGIVFRQMGINLPGIANQQSVYGKRTSIANARPGDLVGWQRGGHIAIYIGNGQILHAPRPGETVQIRNLFRGEAVFAVQLTLPGD